MSPSDKPSGQKRQDSGRSAADGAPQPRHILLLMSGSIACAKASALISAWVKQGHEVQVACTRSATEFIGLATLEGFSGRPVLHDAFAAGQVMDHIHLARWADLVVAAPATSNLINKFSSGIADDAVTSLWQAAYGSQLPMYVVPAMNTHMWNYPATQRSVKQLKAWGITVLPTAEGDLACGETGAGRMLEPEAIMQLIPTSGRVAGPGKRILVTGGGTREAIDAVRYIGNTSSGKTAADLTEKLLARGHDVTWLGAASAIRPAAACQQQTFISFDDLQQVLQGQLAENHFDMVIHAAAVSDFSLDRIERHCGTTQAGAADQADDGSIRQTGGKLSSADGLNLQLKKNPKLLASLKQWSANPDIRVVGFKLTAGATQDQRIAAVERQFSTADIDAVVHNDLDDIRPDQHVFSWHRHGEQPLHCADSTELINHLEALLP